jgi:hypothetical protein
MTRPLNRLGVASSSILRRGKPVDSGGKEPVPINFLDTTNTAPNTYLACIYDALLGIDNALCGRPAIKRITGLWVGTVVTATLLACCGGGGGGGTTPDTSAPTTTAFPSGGIYGALQTVTLTANESATIYYSTDGNDPIPGSANTTSGESPATGIVIAGGTTTLKYFAVDQAQNQELVHTQTYVVDLVSPTVTVTSGAPGSMGLLGTQDITWQTDEAGAYVVELGGTGTPPARARYFPPVRSPRHRRSRRTSTVRSSRTALPPRCGSTSPMGWAIPVPLRWASPSNRWFRSPPVGN